ncbi:MAG: hypothetical protein RL291_1927 [Pseudomonadota bacterium]
MPSDDLTGLLNAFRDVPTSIISDSLDRFAGPLGLRPFHRGGKLAGRALTVRTRAGDNRALHEALARIGPNDVLVVDGAGDVTRALVGEILKEIAVSKGAAGFVIDGAIRDSDAFAAGDFPCYARAVTHLGPYKVGPGEISVPVSIGGHVVSPGDFVVGDMDGVVTFAPARATELLDVCRQAIKREAEIIESIREGRYTGAYGTSKQ